MSADLDPAYLPGGLFGTGPADMPAGLDPDDLPGWAAAYAAAGFAVFPLTPRSKKPRFKCPVTQAHEDAGRNERCPGRCGNDGHGVLDATVDQAKVAAWWAANPTANIGLAVPAGIVVVDVDPRNGGDKSLAALVAEHGPLPATREAISGGPDRGRHIWFNDPGGDLRVPKHLPGLDLREKGNYVVVEPSVHRTGGRYRWVPAGES